MSNTCWLPQLECYQSNTDWQEYEDLLYEIFHHNFIETIPHYNGKQVKIKRYPIDFNKEDAFYHVTCKDYKGEGTRDPDMRRCERIRWIRAFIDNNCDTTNCSECDGIKVWVEPYKNKKRVHILLEEEKYMVVLEHRAQTSAHPENYLLITAFYFDYEHALEKKLKHYEKYKNQVFMMK